MNSIILNNIDSSTIQGLLISKLPPISKPLMRTMVEEIDGRDGDIITKLGYSAYDREVEVGLHGSFDLDAIIRYFNSEGTAVFSNEPDKIYQYEIINQIDFEKLIRYRTATVTFHCQPFKHKLNEPEIGEDELFETLSGDLVSFDGVENGVVKSLIANIEPVQNLHGYDHPWVGGAGVNLFGGIVIEKLNNDETTQASTSDWHSPKYYVNGATALTLKIYENTTYTSGSIGIVTFDSNGTRIEATNFVTTTGITYPYTKTLTLQGTPSYFYIRGYQGGGASGITSIKAQVERGSTATDYQPYSNICPISGWGGVNVNRIGKNWCNKDGDLVLGFWLTSGGVPSITANASNIAFNYKIPIPKGEALTLSANTSINNFGYCTFQADGTYINRINNNNTSSVTIASTTFDRYVLVWVNRNNTAFSSLNSAREWLLSAEVQFEYGTQRTGFVSDGATYTTAVNVWDEEWVAYSGTQIEFAERIPVMAGGKYYVYTGVSGTVYYFADTTSSYLSYENIPVGGKVITVPQNANYMRFISSVNTGNTYNHNISVNFPSTETSYIPFKGEIPTQNYMDTFGHVVYGGTLDVVTGVLTIDRTMIGGSSWVEYGASNGYKAYRIDNCILAKYSSPAENKPMSSAISEFGSFNSSAMDKNIIQLPNSPNSTAYMALLESADPSTVFLTYLIATPQVVQLTAQEVRTLLENNIWADTGDVEVIFPRVGNIINTGNIYSRPTITIYGSGVVDLYINDQQVLQIDLADTEYITINGEEMNAYRGSILANRKVTGDYNNLRFEVGSNTLSVAGNVTEVRVSNYVRWL